MYFSSDFGTATMIFFLVESPPLTNRALPPERLNSTVVLPLPERKFLPWMVSVSPTLTLFGVTLVIFGVLTAAPALAGTTSAPSAAVMTARRSCRRGRGNSLDPRIDHPRAPPEPPAGGGPP